MKAATPGPQDQPEAPSLAPPLGPAHRPFLLAHTHSPRPHWSRPLGPALAPPWPRPLAPWPQQPGRRARGHSVRSTAGGRKREAAAPLTLRALRPAGRSPGVSACADRGAGEAPPGRGQTGPRLSPRRPADRPHAPAAVAASSREEEAGLPPEDAGRPHREVWSQWLSSAALASGGGGRRRRPIPGGQLAVPSQGPAYPRALGPSPGSHILDPQNTAPSRPRPSPWLPQTCFLSVGLLRPDIFFFHMIQRSPGAGTSQREAVSVLFTAQRQSRVQMVFSVPLSTDTWAASASSLL